LGGRNEDNRISEIEARIENVTVEMYQNQRAVKEKMEKTIADNLATRLPTPAEKKVITVQVEKVKIKKMQDSMFGD